MFLSLTKHEKKITQKFCYNIWLILPHVCLDTFPMYEICFAKSVPDGTSPVHAVFYRICIYKMCCFGQNLVSDIVVLVECPYPVFQMLSCLLLCLKAFTCVLMIESYLKYEYLKTKICLQKDRVWLKPPWLRSIPKSAIPFIKGLGLIRRDSQRMGVA